MVISDQNEAKQAPVKKELNEGLAHFYTLDVVTKMRTLPVVSRQDYLNSFKLKPFNKNEKTIDSCVRNSSRAYIF